MPRLVIGNKNYSSWSLRAWLHLRESRVAFEEVNVSLFGDSDWRGELARYTPAGRVPVLVYDDATVWDSSAIIETVCEREPNAVGWPDDPAARAEARAISAEMHSGFLGIRDELPQNIRMRRKLDPEKLTQGCQDQIGRVDNIWSQARERHRRAGPWLFGAFSIADIMYAPVALRFETYEIPLSRKARHFVDQILSLDSISEWARLSAEESESLDFIDDLVPTSESPLVPG